MLKIENINVFYGAIHALKGISVDVKEGEIVTLIGANGAGKSTILRTVSGLLRAKTGNIAFEGKPISSMPAEEIVKLGISQVPVLSVNNKLLDFSTANNWVNQQ